MGNHPLLKVEDLVVDFSSENGPVTAVEGVSFELQSGQMLGLVGESGCGKSVTSLSVMQLLPRPAGRIRSGKILFDSEQGRLDLARLSPLEMSGVRGKEISMIFQEPMTALNPVKTVGSQLAECFELHFSTMTGSEIRSKSVELLERVKIAAPEERFSEYPHQLSGGMRQRVMIAMALACGPKLLIADEPTTALDVTVQAQILDLIKEIQKDLEMAVIFITHDLAVVSEICDSVVVMYAGKVIETCEKREIFESPRHPYTKGLMGSIPRLDSKRKTLLPTILGAVPSLSEMPKGCRFSDRCSEAKDVCGSEVPTVSLSANHSVSCHLFVEQKYGKTTP